MPKYITQETSKFKRQRNRMESRGYRMEKLDEAIRLLENGPLLDPTYQDHDLGGPRIGQRECHIQGDWLLIYKKFRKELVLLLMETGTHSDLFKK